MSKSNTRAVLGLALASGVLIFAGAASAQTGAYTDPSRNVRATLEREHMVLSHTDAVRLPSAAARAARAARAEAPFYGSIGPADPSGKDLSILSQH